MKQAGTFEELHRVSRPVCLAAGFFDGMHLGHQKVIRQTVMNARKVDGEAWVMTFDRHPLRVLNPQAAPRLLTSFRHKMRMLEHLEVDGCLAIPFNRKFAQCKPQDFIAQLKACSPPLQEIMVGRNWRFGQQGKGSARMLAAQCRNLIKVSVARPAVYRGETISSTRTRFSIVRGNLDEAERMLGRPFSILGNVIHGRTVGRQLGYPTANMDTENEVLPPFGVYAVMAWTPPYLLPAVLSLGTRPTFRDAGEGPCMEVHLLDYEGDLYGHDIEVFFIKHIRDEHAFTCREELREQIARDVKQARSILRKTRGTVIDWLTRYTGGNQVSDVSRQEAAEMRRKS